MPLIDPKDVYERAWRKIKANAISSEQKAMDVILAHAFEEQIEAEQPNKKPK